MDAMKEKKRESNTNTNTTQDANVINNSKSIILKRQID